MVRDQRLKDRLAALVADFEVQGYRPETLRELATDQVAPTAEHVPASLGEALDLWRGSEFARTTFGDDVVEHYANMAAVELAAFSRSVTDWERIRGFERL